MSGPDLVAVLPAAGRATRLGPMPGSKEILALDDREPPSTTLDRLLGQLAAAGVRRAVIVLREGKWDIPSHLLRCQLDLEVVYRLVAPTRSVPETLAAALPFVGTAPVLLAFPDLLYEPREALTPLVERWRVSQPELLLALFESDRPEKSDMVELDSQGRVTGLSIKGTRRDLRWAWGAAIWGSRFSQRLVEWVAEGSRAAAQEGELYIGDLVREALEVGFEVGSVRVPRGRFLDIGTPEDLERVREVVGRAKDRREDGR